MTPVLLSIVTSAVTAVFMSIMVWIVLGHLGQRPRPHASMETKELPKPKLGSTGPRPSY